MRPGTIPTSFKIGGSTHDQVGFGQDSPGRSVRPPSPSSPTPRITSLRLLDSQSPGSRIIRHLCRRSAHQCVHDLALYPQFQPANGVRPESHKPRNPAAVRAVSISNMISTRVPLLDRSGTSLTRDQSARAPKCPPYSIPSAALSILFAGILSGPTLKCPVLCTYRRPSIASLPRSAVRKTGIPTVKALRREHLVTIRHQPHRACRPADESLSRLLAGDSSGAV